MTSHQRNLVCASHLLPLPVTPTPTLCTTLSCVFAFAGPEANCTMQVFNEHLGSSDESPH